MQSPDNPQPQQLQDLCIRRMFPDDIKGVMAIESVSFGSHHWAEEAFYNEMKNQLSEYSVLISSASTVSVLGYTGLWMIGEECHMTTLAIHPVYRGYAFGELLLAHAIQRCLERKIAWLTLEVRISNIAGQNLYYKYGMEAVSIRPKYYQDNREDALIMTTSPLQTETFQVAYKTNRLKLFERLKVIPEGFGQ
jgi:ribosomal-protein-alanine N-acetyltransferase